MKANQQNPAGSAQPSAARKGVQKKPELGLVPGQPSSASAMDAISYLPEIDLASVPLSDRRLPIAHTRRLAQQIGQAVGNLALQRLLLQRQAPSFVQRQPAAPAQSASGASQTNQVEEPVEQIILAQLNLPFQPTDIPGLQQRKRSLILIFQAIPSPERERIQDRLLKEAEGDVLAKAFHLRLSTPLRKSLIRVLSGEPVPLPSNQDSVLMRAFLPTLSANNLNLSPNLLVLAPWMTGGSVTVTPQAKYSPPADTDGLTLDWHLLNAKGAEVGYDKSTWPPGNVNGQPSVFSIDQAGLYQLKVNLIENGLLVKVINRDVVTLQYDTNKGGDRQKVSLAAAREMSDEQLVEQAAALRRRIAEFDFPKPSIPDQWTPIPDEFQGLRQALNAVEMAALERNLSLQAMPKPVGNLLPWSRWTEVFKKQYAGPPGPPIVDPGVEALSADPTFLRSLLEKIIKEHGWDTMEHFAEELIWRAPKSENPDYSLPPDLEKLGERIGANLAKEYHQIKQEKKVFLSEFETNAGNLLLMILQQSETEVHQAMSTFGLVFNSQLDTYLAFVEGKSDSPSYYSLVVLIKEAREFRTANTPETGVDRAALQDAAKKLYAKKTELDELHARMKADVDHLIRIEAKCSSHHDQKSEAEQATEQAMKKYKDFYDQNPKIGARLSPFGTMRFPFTSAPTYRPPTTRQILEADSFRVGLEINRKTRLYEALWSEYEIQFPILAAFRKGGSEFQSLVQGDTKQVSDTLAAVILEKLIAISKTRYGYKNGKFSVWELPRVVAMTKAKMTVVPGNFLDRAINEKMHEAMEPSLFQWAMIAISIGLAIASLGATLPLSVELGALALDAYMAYQDIEKYEYGTALASTDFNAARSLAAESPALTGVIFDLLGLGLGTAGLIKRVNQVKRLSRISRDALADEAEVKHLTDELNQLGVDNDIGRLGDEVVDITAHMDEEITQVMNSPSGVVRPYHAMSAEELTELCQRLFKRPIRPMQGEIHFYASWDEYADAFRKKWPNMEPPTGGYHDPNTGHIFVSPHGDLLTTIHESIHKIAYETFPMGRALLGDFLDEGITEWLTRSRLGPQLGFHGYDLHVRFVDLLERTVGATAIENAMLHGSYRSLREAVKAFFKGSEEATYEFFSTVRRIGSDSAGAVSDPQALERAFAMLGGNLDEEVSALARANMADPLAALPGPRGASRARWKTPSQLRQDLEAFDAFVDQQKNVNAAMIRQWMKQQGIDGWRRSRLYGAIRARESAAAVLAEGKKIVLEERTFLVPGYPSRRMDMVFTQDGRLMLWESKSGSVTIPKALRDILAKSTIRLDTWEQVNQAYQAYLRAGGKYHLGFSQFMRDWWLLKYNPDLVGIIWRADSIDGTLLDAMHSVGFDVHLTH